MRFHRNIGARGAAEWVASTDDHGCVLGYARTMLVKNVRFVLHQADGWALGELKWAAEPMSRSRNEMLHQEIASKLNPWGLARLPLHGWIPLWFRRDPPAFMAGGREMTGAKALLLGPGLAMVWRPTYSISNSLPV